MAIAVINSVADVIWMILGFGIARRLPVWATIVLALGFELLTLYVIRDNLTLNVLMLVAPGRIDRGLARRRLMRALLAAGLLLAAAPAEAAEIFAGVLAHDVDSPLTEGGLEDGADLQIGWRGGRLGGLAAIGAPSPYVFVSAATGGGTHFAAAGLSWRLGGRLFVRPGLGLAVHSRGSDGVANGLRTDLGSRILFAPELGLGYRIGERVAIEAAWVHLSHAQLLSRQNPGMDSVGVRLSFQLR